MTTYVALLRGINVGGHNKIKMADLKQMLEQMGLARVKTYIQSGNVLFDSEDSAETLEHKLEDAIHKTFGFSISVMLRTSTEWQQIVAACPFPFDTLAEGESIHLLLLKDAPTPEAIANLPDVPPCNDEIHITGREIYLYLRQSILDSPLPKKVQKLGPNTARNWKTILKLHSML